MKQGIGIVYRAGQVKCDISSDGLSRQEAGGWIKSNNIRCKWSVNLKYQKMDITARVCAVERFAPDVIAEQYKALYQAILV